MIWDVHAGSQIRINIFSIPDPWAKKEPDPGSQIPHLDSQHFFKNSRYLILIQCGNTFFKIFFWLARVCRGTPSLMSPIYDF
jgi:hypothetical protein